MNNFIKLNSSNFERLQILEIEKWGCSERIGRRYLNFRMVLIKSYLSFRKWGYLEISDFQDFIFSGFQDFRFSGFQDFKIRISYFHNFRISDFQNKDF